MSRAIWRDKFSQGFWISRRRQLGAWHRYLRLGTLSLITVVMIIAVSVLTKAPAVAAFLTDWRFDPAVNQLDITLQTQTTPRYFLLAEPPRIVIDLPDTQLGGVETQQAYSGSVRQVRVSQFQADITRIVLELSPEVVLSPEQVQLQQVGVTEVGTRWVLRPLIAQTATEAAPMSPDSLPPANLPTNQTGVVNAPPVNRPEASTPVLPTTAMPPATLPPTVFSTNQTPAVSVPSLQPIPEQTPTPVTTSPPLDRQPESVSPALSSSSVVEFGQPLPKTTPAAPVLTSQSASPTLDSGAAVDAPETAPTTENPDVLLPAGTQLTLRFPGDKALSLQTYQLRQEVLLLEKDLRDRSNQIIALAGTPVIGHFETSSSGTRFIAQAIAINGKNLAFNAQSDILGSNQQASEGSDATATITNPNTSQALTIQPGQVLQVQLQADWPL